MKTLKDILTKSKEMVVCMSFITVNRETRYIRINLEAQSYKCFDISGEIWSIKEDTVVESHIIFDEKAFKQIEEKAKQNQQRKKEYEDRKKRIEKTFSKYSQLLDD